MQYLSITLRKYKRLALSHIEEIKITPFNKIQLLLGTNGSGKSSLLSQITPLPASHQDYHKGGYKIIEILHNNSRYELKSLFTLEGNRYHFIKDGVELNDGLTATTFRELVKQQFRVTQDVQDVLTGATTFSAMSVADRRSWLTRISDCDYTYAIQYFSRLKERHRDMIGAIKLQQARLVQEKSKLLTSEEEDKVRYEMDILNSYFETLLSRKSPIKTSVADIRTSIETLEADIVGLVRDYRSFHRVFGNLEGYTNKEGMESDLIESRAHERNLELQIQKLCEVIESQDTILESLKNVNVTDIGDIDARIDRELNEVSTLKSQYRLGLYFSDPQSALNSINSVSDNLSYLSIELVENSDKRFSRDNYIEALEKAKALEVKQNSLLQKQTVAEAKIKELEHFRDHNKLECPKCSHVWSKGFDSIQYSMAIDNLSAVRLELAQCVLDLETANRHTETIRAYLEVYRTYVNISKSFTDLNPLWSYLTDNSIIFNDPRKIIQVVETVKGDLSIAIKVDSAEKRLKESMSIKQALRNSQESNVASFIAHGESLHAQLYELNAQLQIAKQKCARLISYREAVKQMESISLKLQSHSGQVESKTQELLEAQRMQALNEAIQLVQIELSNREQMIAKADVQHGIINSIQEQILDLTENAKLLKIALDELSPSQGLIAKGLTGFINHFVAQMNLFIKNVWLYPMELMPILPDEDDGVELDYKFQISINGETVDTVPDISKGSAGMREIIDLAFKVVSMMYLGLEKAPLILDEFGSKLDAAHRQSVQVGISNMINTCNFSQIFIVSHYENAYGSLKNADVCVLHPANVQMPVDMVFNKHVVIS